MLPCCQGAVNSLSVANQQSPGAAKVGSVNATDILGIRVGGLARFGPLFCEPSPWDKKGVESASLASMARCHCIPAAIVGIVGGHCYHVFFFFSLFLLFSLALDKILLTSTSAIPRYHNPVVFDYKIHIHQHHQPLHTQGDRLGTHVCCSHTPTGNEAADSHQHSAHMHVVV